jgi:hypothetical protein
MPSVITVIGSHRLNKVNMSVESNQPRKTNMNSKHETFAQLAMALVKGHALADRCVEGTLNELQCELVCEGITRRVNKDLNSLMKRSHETIFQGLLREFGNTELYHQYTDGLISIAELIHHWLKTEFNANVIVSDSEDAKNLALQLESLENKLSKIHSKEHGCLMYLESN